MQRRSQISTGLDQPLPSADEAALDQDELEYRSLRRDLPGVSGASAQGIVAIAVSRIPTKNEFFRTHATFRPTVKLVNVEVGMEQQYFAVTPDMEQPLHGIGIGCAEHTLYLTMSPRGSYHVIPINCETENEYTRTKEIGLLDGVQRWVCSTPTGTTKCTRCSLRRRVASTTQYGRH